jgi:hypothetical protein
MHTRCSRVRICLTVAVLGLIGVAVGCGETGNPARPTAVARIGTAAEAAATTAPESQPNLAVTAQASAEHLTPTELTGRGWTCFEPIPNRIVCSHPNQGLPPFADPPPADRPASFSFLIFDGTGGFVGTEVLLRTDLYKGQICESTDRPYDFVAVIGYYECVHTAGR